MRKGENFNLDFIAAMAQSTIILDFILAYTLICLKTKLEEN